MKDKIIYWLFLEIDCKLRKLSEIKRKNPEKLQKLESGAKSLPAPKCRSWNLIFSLVPARKKSAVKWNETQEQACLSFSQTPPFGSQGNLDVLVQNWFVRKCGCDKGIYIVQEAWLGWERAGNIKAMQCNLCFDSRPFSWNELKELNFTKCYSLSCVLVPFITQNYIQPRTKTLNWEIWNEKISGRKHYFWLNELAVKTGVKMWHKIIKALCNFCSTFSATNMLSHIRQ